MIMRKERITVRDENNIYEASLCVANCKDIRIQDYDFVFNEEYDEWYLPL